MTINNGTVATNEDIPARSAISLWQNIEAEADRALRSVQSSATLRFGHDTALYRLLSLLFDVNVPPAGAREEASLVVLGDEMEKMDRIVPMAANLQMIFYKNAKDSVLVKFMLNERDIMLSPVGQVIYGTHYYSWNAWKQEMHERIHRLEHIRQLNAINTMVGTAQANTQTAGMFGKGSEEHGQTILQFSFRMVRTSGLLRRRIQNRNVSHLIIIRIPICRASAAATGWWADVRRIMVLSRWLRLVESSVCSQNRELRHSAMKMKSLILTTMLFV